LSFFEGTASAQNLSRRAVWRSCNEASDRFAVPARWIRAVMKIESRGEREVPLFVERAGAP
jgi:hypothetical protein